MRKEDASLEQKITFCHKIFRLEELGYIEQKQELTCDQINEIGQIVNYVKDYLKK